MDSVLAQAMEIVKAQASTRAMSTEEITSMIKALTASTGAMTGEVPGASETESKFTLDDAKKAVKEKSVTCMECGKVFKVLTRRHLATHDLTPEDYRSKWGYKKGAALVAKSLGRDRRKKMQDMKLWEKRSISKNKPEGPRVESKFPAQEEIQ